MNELKLDSPITKEQWSMILDDEFEYTYKVKFKTPKGKEVEFERPRRGTWIVNHAHIGRTCSECGGDAPAFLFGNQYNSNFCPTCGAKMIE